MKFIVRYSLLLVLAIMAVLGASPVFAQEPAQGWRDRLSMRDDMVTEDVTEEMRFGREVAARILSRYGYYDNYDMMKYVNLVGKSVALSANRQEIDFRFAILNSSEVNAYAAPGGYIFVTKGALAQMKDEAELASVLSHEIAHVTCRHIVKELGIRSESGGGATGLAMLIGGTTEAARSAFSQAVDKAADILFKDGLKREDEVQADKTAVMYAALAGYDPSALIRYFERIMAIKGKSTEILDKTHPAYQDRIAWLKGMMGEEGIDATSYKANKERFETALKAMK